MVGQKRGLTPNEGFSLVELLIVFAVVGILTAVAVPQMVSQRRLLRSTGVTREIMTQLRYARQLAMSERQAITFQYNNNTKQIRIIDHNNDTANPNSGTAVLADPSYPNTNAPATVVSVIPLAQGGLSTSEINYGIPTTSTGLPAGAPAFPTGALADGVAMTALSGSVVNITFQANGSVIDPTGISVAGIPLQQGVPLSRALFVFNNKAAQSTASAISVLGASGRIKVWRYTTNVNKYME